MHLSALAVFLYILLRLIVPLPLGWLAKLLLASTILVISFKHYVFMKFFGGAASPDLPRLVLVVMGWLYASVLLLFAMLLAKDIVSLALWLISKATNQVMALPFGQMQAVAVMAAVSLLIGAYATWQALRVPEIKVREIVLNKLPAEMDGLSIIQISDLHVSNMLGRGWVEAVVEKVNAAAPDLIVLTGDMVDGHVVLRGKDTKALALLEAPYGVFGCVGNHEYYSGYKPWLKEFDKLGIKMLLNEHVVLNIKQSELVLAGVTDPVAAQFRQVLPDAQAALAGAPEKATCIMLAHQPVLAQEYAKAGVDLQLAGHTHGGQVLGFGLISGKFNSGFIRGHHRVGDMSLWVSPGAGLWNGLPMRLGVSAELSNIVLRAA